MRDKENTIKRTFTIFYSEPDISVVDGVEKLRFNSMDLPIELQLNYDTFFKGKKLPTSEELRLFLNKKNEH